MRARVHTDSDTLLPQPGFRSLHRILGLALALAALAVWSSPAAGAEDRGQGWQPGQLLPADRLANHAVVDGNGRQIGQVEAIIIHAASGKILLAVISQGGVLGLGEKSTPVPWQSLRLSGTGGLVLDTDKAHLDAAPSYRPKELLPTPDPAYLSAIYGQWGMSWPEIQQQLALVEPAGQGKSPSEQFRKPGTTVDIGGGQRIGTTDYASPALGGQPAPGPEPPTAQDERREPAGGNPLLSAKPLPPDAKTLARGGVEPQAPGQQGPASVSPVRVIEGTIVGINDAPGVAVPGLGGTPGMARTLTIKGKDNVNYIVELGPVETLEEQRLNPRMGALVQARGTVRQEGDRQVMAATDLVVDGVPYYVGTGR